MEFRAYKSQLITGIHVAPLFAVVGAFHGVKVATFFTLAGVLGYLNAFAAFRSLLAVIRRRHVSRRTVTVVALTAAGSVALAWFGYWPSLAICTLSFVFIDAVVLRFVGPPVGTAASAP
jgi:ABC-type proline/glycine betaine transport system permease subunit